MMRMNSMLSVECWFRIRSNVLLTFLLCLFDTMYDASGLRYERRQHFDFVGPLDRSRRTLQGEVQLPHHTPLRFEPCLMPMLLNKSYISGRSDRLCVLELRLLRTLCQ